MYHGQSNFDDNGFLPPPLDLPGPSGGGSSGLGQPDPRPRWWRRLAGWALRRLCNLAITATVLGGLAWWFQDRMQKLVFKVWLHWQGPQGWWQQVHEWWV